MISVVCVYNKEGIFTNVLLKSLRKQSAEYELIALDNTGGRFRSAAEAYNFGGARAKGDYIMFAHQDMWLVTRTWLEDAERLLGNLPSLGVAGVGGLVSISERSRTSLWAKASCYFLDETTVVELQAIQAPEEVQTLDECLLLVPRPVFDRLKFDETAFDGWDCYAADYCLCAENLGLKAYVIPAPCSHCCARSTLRPWEFKGLLKYQKRLYAKHRHNYETICTWMGDINRRSLRSWSWHMFLGPLRHRVVPSPGTFVRRELAGCESVLDLNCEYRSLVGRLKFRYSLGVDSFEPYLRESQRRAFHSEYVLADVGAIPFKAKSFDAVIALDTLERLTKEEGTALLHRMEELARKRVIVTTPNRYPEHHSNGGHPSPEQKPGWETAELVMLGFRVRGRGGRKSAGEGKSILKYRLASLRRVAAVVDQLLVYHCPKSAGQLMAVKHLDFAAGLSQTGESSRSEHRAT